MGVSGAAWATIISQGAACVFVLASLRLPNLPVPLRWGRFQPKLCRRVLSLGLSPFLTYALDSIILIILNSILQRCGGPGEGDILITCAAIVQSYMLLIAMPMSGITLGCQRVVSFNLGAGNGERVKQASLPISPTPLSLVAGWYGMNFVNITERRLFAFPLIFSCLCPNREQKSQGSCCRRCSCGLRGF